jgi:hypothetical protein
MEQPLDPVFTIHFKATNTRVEGLTVETVNESKSEEASVTFITKAKKRWKVRLSEFSFVLSPIQPKPALL